ncbi:MAG TPA: TetR/AcrR family transcriptional regulator, partial [Myxococcus sp.]|nr:TetR/AcrR family transcriptional regulator [Myxococcus sp.]
MGSGADGANIMRDAAGLLAWRGYDNVRAEELARVARISVGTLYRHYGAKQGFAREVRRFTEQLLSRVAWDAYSRANLGAESDYRRAFHAFWWELACFALGQPALFCFAFLHWHPDEDSPPQTREGEVKAPPPPVYGGRAGYRIPGEMVPVASRGWAREVIRSVLTEGEREGALAPGAARVGETLVWGV